MSPFKSIKGRALGKLLEGYKSSDIGKGFGAGSGADTTKMTGGNIVVSPDGTIIYHVFTTPGTLTITTGNQPIFYTIVGGGGGGAGYGPAYFPGVSGQATTALGFTAYGGGGGGPYPGGAGKAGGSGGGGGTSADGGSGLNPSTPGPVLASFPAYIPGTTQGYPGGAGASTYDGGGGGGAGQPGEDATSSVSCGDGGDGAVLLNSAPIAYREGVPTAYGTSGPGPGRWVAGGGGGGAGSTPARGVGGAGGGADGGKAATDPVRAIDNTGGGGGGYENDGGGGGAGGGGAGGYVDGELDNIIPGTSYPIVIGSGGSPAPTPANNGGGSGIVIIAASNQ